MVRIGFVGLSLAFMVATAFAQTVTVPVVPETTTIAIPIAVWAEAARETILGIVIALAAWGMRALPENVVNILRTMRAEQLLNKAVDYALNLVIGAAKNTPIINVDVGNKAVALAVQYAIDNGPTFLIKWMGGEAGIREKVIARIPVGSNVALTP